MFAQQFLQPKLSRRRYVSVSYALQNNTVFRRAQNWVSVSDGSRADNGSEFQSVGPETAKHLWPSKQYFVPHWPKSGGQKNFCSLRSQNLSPHFQNRGAVPGYWLSVQHRATKLITGMEDTSSDDRVKRLGLTWLNVRRLKSDLIEIFKVIGLNGNYSIHSELFRPPGPAAAGRVGLYILLLYFLYFSCQNL